MKIKYLLCVLVMLCVTQASFAQIKSQQECFYDGQFSSSNIDMPSEMYPDQKGEVRVTLRNVPSGSPIQRDELLPSSSETLYPPTTLAGESNTVRYGIEAPYYLGSYELEFVLMFKGQKFGEFGVTKTVKIVPKK